ncbi:MAG: 3-oxoadipate CoA-transferase [Nisaea sp.]|jgi:3-oxoadipate CoA-transferase alpha subunit|nr:3-oxoadipate CoA-transferase [Nisaea sp.]OUX96393.1 MAG: 3-oxoadipate CoA-transferase [Candidatus Endolissoclinum sp. TMED26]
MAINKIADDMVAALEGTKDGATVLVGGFGNAGLPNDLIHALIDQGATDLTVVANNAGSGTEGLAALFAAGRVRKIICSYPRAQRCDIFDALYKADKVELELNPQGTLSERMRAAGAGIPGFYTATGIGTELADGKEIRNFDGRDYVFETALKGDLALIAAYKGDRWGNLLYKRSQRNFGPVMAAAATVTVAQIRQQVELGDIDPDDVHTPGIYVDKLVFEDLEREWDV